MCKVELGTCTSTVIHEEAVAFERWQKVADLEEKYYKQKSNIHWLQVGDRNNKYFHNGAKLKEARNTIEEFR